MKDEIKQFINYPLLSNRWFPMSLWFTIALTGTLKCKRSFNNSLIFRGVYWHTVNQTSLCATYPAEYGDVNYYGSVFSLVIASFAILPLQAGILPWLLFLTA